MFGDDRLDPRASLPAPERTRLREMAASVARAVYRDLLATLGEREWDEIEADGGATRPAGTSDEHRRFLLGDAPTTNSEAHMRQTRSTTS